MRDRFFTFRAKTLTVVEDLYMIKAAPITHLCHLFHFLLIEFLLQQHWWEKGELVIGPPVPSLVLQEEHALLNFHIP